MTPSRIGDAGIAEHQIGIDFPPGAQAMAVGAHAERRVEGELPGLELRKRQTADRAGKSLGEDVDARLRPPCRLTTSTIPSAVFSAVSIESFSRDGRWRAPPADPPRPRYRDSAGGSGPEPSPGRRSGHRPGPGRSPRLRTSSSRSRNSPFRPRTSGASTSIRVSSGQLSTVSVICAGALPGDRTCRRWGSAARRRGPRAVAGSRRSR